MSSSIHPPTIFPTSLLNEPSEPLSTPEHPSAIDPPAPFSFSGSGREYFGIWIVNLILTIATCGVYSAWAKVRRTQYFYANTWVAGANFNYLGQPGALLRGRLVALVLLALYYFSKEFSPFFLVLVIVVLAVLMPWLLRRSLHFRAHNTMHRGLRFQFTGGLARAYWVFLVWNALSLASALLFAPAAMQRARAYQFNNASFGTTPFRFTASARQYYGIWLRTAFIWILMIIIGSLSFGFLIGFSGATLRTTGPLTVGAVVLVAFWLTRAHYVAHLQNLIWNHTTLGPHRFSSSARVAPLFRIMLKNTVLTVLTLGLYRPFAVVNVVRYRLSCLTFIPGAPLAETNAVAGRNASAVGEEAADLFDMEIAL